VLTQLNLKIDRTRDAARRIAVNTAKLLIRLRRYRASNQPRRVVKSRLIRPGWIASRLSTRFQTKRPQIECDAFAVLAAPKGATSIIGTYPEILGPQGTNRGAAFARAGTENAALVTDVTDLLQTHAQRRYSFYALTLVPVVPGECQRRELVPDAVPPSGTINFCSTAFPSALFCGPRPAYIRHRRGHDDLKS
jgi:hypothetical protein